MRVLVTTSTYPLDTHEYWGNFVQDLNLRLKEIGIETLTIAPKCQCKKRTRLKGLRVQEINFFLPKYLQLLGCPPGLEHNSRSILGKIQLPFYLLMFTLQTLKHAIKFKPHIIHANWAIPAGIISLIVSKITRIPVIVTVHGADAYQRGIRRSLVKFVLEKVNLVVPVSDHIKRKLLAFSNPRNLTVVENVVDGPTIQSAKRQLDIQTVKAKFGILPNEKVVFTVRRLVREKRVQDMISAAKHVLQKIPNAVFVIAGDGPELPNLRQQAEDLGVSAKVRIIGAITEVEKLELLAISDVCVHTSIQEGLSLALLEAMAAELIVVASSAAGQSDTITHGETGLLFPPADVQTLSSRIEYALSNQPELEKIKKQAARFIIDSHSSEKHTRSYLKIYETCRESKS